MPPLRRVVLTGLGVVCPLGLDLVGFRAALAAGRSAVRPIRSFDASGLPIRIGAEIDGFDARDYLDKKDRKSLKMMVRTIQLAVAAARLAVTDARLEPGAVDPERFGVDLGAGCIPGELVQLGPAAHASLQRDGPADRIDLARWGGDGLRLIPPMWILNHVPNMPACHVSILHDARGPNNTVTQSDAAGLLAVGEAFRVLQRGAADVMLTGGADTRVAPIAALRHSLFSQLSRRHDEPEKACRPFDRHRDGTVLGEGGSLLLLEAHEHAAARGAAVRAELLGFGSAFDRRRTGEGLARAVRAALAEAGVEADAIDHVNAHAAGTTDDAWEARGLRQALGDVPVVAFKSYLGNLGSGGSTVELAASLLALEDGTLPPTLNHDETDPACPVVVVREPRPIRRRCVLKVACTEMGQCAALVLKRA